MGSCEGPRQSYEVSSRRHLDRKRPGIKISARALAGLGLYTPELVALWARKHGLLSVYIEAYPVHGVFPACWQVVRPGYKTDPNAAGWMRGRKTFIFLSGKDKLTSEQNARNWASAHFGVEDWVRIEGFANAVFPASVGEALQIANKDIIIARNRTPSRTVG